MWGKKEHPLVILNCGITPSQLLEAELFGHVHDAYPGAIGDQAGKIEHASGGTLVLNEITELTPEMQLKLLRVLQDKETERLGGKNKISVNCRIVATTNKDILGLVQKGQFRQDLYYRLYVIHIEVPSLRERAKDIPILAEDFLSKFSKDNGKSLSFTSESMALLTDHNWPGNVRELENVIQRAAIMADGNVIEKQHLPLNQENSKQEMAEWIQMLPIGETLEQLRPILS